jgi:hypothetical protein
VEGTWALYQKEEFPPEEKAKDGLAKSSNCLSWLTALLVATKRFTARFVLFVKNNEDCSRSST